MVGREPSPESKQSLEDEDEVIRIEDTDPVRQAGAGDAIVAKKGRHKKKIAGGVYRIRCEDKNRHSIENRLGDGKC